MNKNEMALARALDNLREAVETWRRADAGYQGFASVEDNLEGGPILETVFNYNGQPMRVAVDTGNLDAALRFSLCKTLADACAMNYKESITDIATAADDVIRCYSPKLTADDEE